MATYTVHEYAAHLRDTGRRLDPLVLRTMNRAAFNMREDWRDRAAKANPKHARKYPGTIVMRRTIVDSNGVVVASVEPGPWGQGKLGLVLERTGNRWSTPQGNDAAVVAAEAPNLERWLARIAKEVIE